MTSINISLPEVLKVYVDERVVAGGYGTVSEYICDLVRQDQQQSQQQLEMLLLKGFDSEPATPMASSDWAEIRLALKAKISESLEHSAD
jgi:antitoxin ParD1/3/4